MSAKFRVVSACAGMRGRAARQASVQRRTIVSLLLGAASGAALVYGLEPGAGRRRRSLAGDRILGLSHRGVRRLVRTARMTTSQTKGSVRGLVHRLRAQPTPELDDVELAHKVESIVYRDPSVPKGHISINAENGRVFLRGQVERPDLVDQLEKAVRRVAGVQDVENLLHLPGTPAPHPRSGRYSRSTAGREPTA